MKTTPLDFRSKTTRKRAYRVINGKAVPVKKLSKPL